MPHVLSALPYAHGFSVEVRPVAPACPAARMYEEAKRARATV